MGRDKAALIIDGRQLAERTGDLLQRVAGPVVEVGPGFTRLHRTCEDPPGSGPLAAMAAGTAELDRLRYAGSVLVVATDLPRLTDGYLTILAGHPVPGPAHSVVPRDATGRPQPLCALYSATAVSVAHALVAQGECSMQALLEAVPITWLDPGPLNQDPLGRDVLNDIDTPEDLDAILHPRPVLRPADDPPDEVLRP
jgi:molybdopterin-guanine dinucleotide biosynthesis protein A